VASSSYARVMRVPSVTPMLGAALLARMPFGILGLALVLFIREQTGSFAVAGAVSGGYALAAAASSPVLGRLFDRIGPTRVLVPAGTASGVSLVGLVVLGLEDAPAGVLVASAALSGALTPPISPALRVLLRDALGDSEGLLMVSYALDAILLDLVFVVGPLLAAVIVAVASPAAAVIAAVACISSGTLWFGLLAPARRWRGETRERHPAGALASKGMRTLMLTTLPLGICLGALEVTMPAFGREQGSGAIAGVALSVISVGSAAGGLLYGSIASRREPLRDWLVFMFALPTGLGLLAAAHSILALLLIAPFAGAALAPLTTVENALVPEVAPEGTLAESFTWVITATVLGVSAGSAMAGALVDAAGWRWAQAAAGGLGLVGAVFAVARRHTLAPVDPGTPALESGP
jgi:MFS family permease